MTKHYLKIALILVLLVDISGCAGLRRKFTRKKQPRKEDYSFYMPEEYKPKPAHESYQEHYILWRNWHMDLERIEDTSYLKDMAAANEAIKHLMAMKDLLQEDKAEELGPQIADMEKLLVRLKERKRDVLKDIRSRRLLEKVGRIVINRFSYNRMKDYIKSESQESGGGEVK